MATLVVGATGATGRLLVQELLARGQEVRALVRAPEKLPQAVRDHPGLTAVQGSILGMDDAELTRAMAGCRTVASCLGHTMSLGGVFGPPYRLVTEATRRLCRAMGEKDPGQPGRFVLMNTAANRGPLTGEAVPWAEAAVLGALRVLMPPHRDNERAAAYLRQGAGNEDGAPQWVVVRPDTLVDRAQVSDYVVHPSPTRSPIFDPGRTSRINVAHFMAELIEDSGLWAQWQGRMPVIYDVGAA